MITNWQIVPLEFRRAWNKQLSGWHPVEVRDATPALYRVGFTLKKYVQNKLKLLQVKFSVSAPLKDTFVDIQDWSKGIVIVNGFVLGRIFAVGPQQTLYLPAGLLQEGENEIVVFEHFRAPEYLKFSDVPIFGYGTYIEN